MSNTEILILYGHDYPEGMAMSKRLHLYAKGLIENGIDVKIAILRSKSPQQKKGLIYLHENVKYYYIQNALTLHNIIIKKLAGILDPIYTFFHLLNIIRTSGFIWVIGFNWQTQLLIIALCKLFNKKVFSEVNEYPYAYSLGKFDNNWLRKFRQWIVLNIIYKNYNGFIVISDNLYNLVSRYKKNSSKILKVPILINGVVKNAAAKRYEHLFILHAGTLDENKDGIVHVFEAFAIACKKITLEIKFLLTNRNTVNSTLNKINSVLTHNNLKNRVIFHNSVPIKTLEKYMENCTLSVINRPLNNQNLYNFSTKLGEYMSYGIPVITTNIGEMANYLEDNVNCFIVEPNNADKIASKIVFIIENEEVAVEVGNNARITAEKFFHYKIHGKRLAFFFNSFHQ